MIRIDDTLLEEIGLIALPKPDRDQMLRQIYETLEMRVGMRLAERMTDQQLDEFESFLPNEQTGAPGDEAGALRWLETNFPDYKQVVADELDKLKIEIKKDAPKILETMQAQGGQLPPQPGAAPQPQPTNYAPQPSGPTPPQPAPAPQPFQSQSPQQTQPLGPQPAQQPLPPLPNHPASTSQPQTDFGSTQPLTPIGQDSQVAATPSPQDDSSSQQQPPTPPAPQQGGGMVPPPPGA